jgi:CRISPR/Cas system-associated protein Csx1
MVIDPKVREKRLQQMTFLYELITKDNEEDKEILYKTLKEGIEENQNKVEESVINLIYSILENTLSITLAESKKMYKSYNDEIVIALADMLYHGDDKTLEQRVHSWMNERNLMNLFYHLCLIIDTETYQLIHQTIKEKVNIEYIEVVGDAGCDKCAEYCDGEVYPADEIELPPYHPGCLCEAIMYEKEDILGDI